MEAAVQVVQAPVGVGAPGSHPEPHQSRRPWHVACGSVLEAPGAEPMLVPRVAAPAVASAWRTAPHPVSHPTCPQ